MITDEARIFIFILLTREVDQSLGINVYKRLLDMCLKYLHFKNSFFIKNLQRNKQYGTKRNKYKSTICIVSSPSPHSYKQILLTSELWKSQFRKMWVYPFLLIQSCEKILDISAIFYKNDNYDRGLNNLLLAEWESLSS